MKINIFYDLIFPFILKLISFIFNNQCFEMLYFMISNKEREISPKNRENLMFFTKSNVIKML